MHTSTRMTEIRRTGRATAGWSFASSCGEAGRISCCLSIPIGSYRPAFDTVSVHPVAIEGQIRVETPEGSINVVPGTPAFKD